MRRNIPAIFAISALIVMILCSACTLLPSGGKTPQQEGGLTQVNVPVETSRISYEEALQKFGDYTIHDTAEAKTIYYIVAKDVDETGKATSWVFGINTGAGGNLLVYDRTGWTVFPWSPHIPEKIALDQVVSPSNLFAKNRNTIVSGPSDRRDLELQQGIYTLTIYSGSSNRILTFNATTGALITQT
jgi:hypothetical protein